MAMKYRLNETLPALCKELKRNLAVQGEIVGQSISSNRLKFNHVDFYVFDIFDIDEQNYLDAMDRYKIVRQLRLNHVPVIESNHRFIQMPLQEIIVSADGKSALSQEPREGLVYKQRDKRTPASFKIISNAYLLKHGL
jgi:ATP-dependent RNA circularization protein (DNA/RNA ligase family)